MPYGVRGKRRGKANEGRGWLRGRCGVYKDVYNTNDDFLRSHDTRRRCQGYASLNS